MDRLAVILADMIKSAVSWEKEHGLPQHDNHKTEPQKQLTALDGADTLNMYENVDKGENDDYRD